MVIGPNMILTDGMTACDDVAVQSYGTKPFKRVLAGLLSTIGFDSRAFRVLNVTDSQRVGPELPSCARWVSSGFWWIYPR